MNDLIFTSANVRAMQYEKKIPQKIGDFLCQFEITSINCWYAKYNHCIIFDERLLTFNKVSPCVRMKNYDSIYTAQRSSGCINCHIDKNFFS